ncbi:MAG: hypothetical protein RIC55_22850 [Pirellulaceae bacterium]
MEFNRNHYLMAGMVILLLGVQFRLVDSFVLNDQTTAIVDKQLKATAVAAADDSTAALTQVAPSSRLKVIRPPKWVGWALISVGGVLVLHSLAMKRPD